MPGSSISRLLRPAILLAAGILVGQGALTVASPTAPSATSQTRTTSCMGLDFQPIDSRTDYSWDGRWRYRTTSQPDGWFYCPADLPDRAVIKKVSFTLRDISVNQSVRFCSLARASLLAADNTFEAIASIPETGLEAQPGAVRRSDTTIASPVVDNTKWAYAYQCQIDYGQIDSAESALAGIGGASVTYSISAANG